MRHPDFPAIDSEIAREAQSGSRPAATVSAFPNRACPHPAVFPAADGHSEYFHRWEAEMEPEKEEEASEEEIQAFIDAGQEEGILEHDEGEMIQSIVHFGDKVAREVMTPRTQIVAVDASSPLEKLLQVIVSTRHARIPIYRDDLDNIEGIVHERDLLRIWQKGDKTRQCPCFDQARPLRARNEACR